VIGTTRVPGILDVNLALLLSCRGQRSMAVCARGRQQSYHKGRSFAGIVSTVLPRCDITRISIWHREQDLKTINGGRALLVHIPLDTSDGIGLIDECGGIKAKN
jgi:hypothetical protein